jgi:fructokinase
MSGQAASREDRHLITYLGEVLIDFLPLAGPGDTPAFGMHPGGSPLNAAVATARLGGRAALAAAVSTDVFGRILRRHVSTERVDTSGLVDRDAPTTLAFVALEGGEPVFTFYGEGAADTHLRLDDLPDELLRETSILQVGSISLLRGETPACALAACERLQGRALLAFDPNVRPNLVADEPGYRSLIGRLLALVDLVKISAADLAWLRPGTPVEDAARSLLVEGPVLVVVTRGGGPVLAVRRGSEGPAVLSVPGFSVPVADPVGAGDSFDAALLTAFAAGGVVQRDALTGLPGPDLVAAIRFASAVAALNCTRVGADPPDRSTVDAFLATH